MLCNMIAHKPSESKGRFRRILRQTGNDFSVVLKCFLLGNKWPTLSELDKPRSSSIRNVNGPNKPSSLSCRSCRDLKLQAFKNLLWANKANGRTHFFTTGSFFSNVDRLGKRIFFEGEDSYVNSPLDFYPSFYRVQGPWDKLILSVCV